jgi:organic radical activating enzyme
MTMGLEMVSPRKIFWHGDKVSDFLAGGPIFPATLELGLTTACDRSCPDCPSRRGRPGLFLDADTAVRLFALCRGRTFGAILSGGEPTLHPGFGGILAAARENGFRDVVVISNGSGLSRAKVAEPLLQHASAVRVSLYDWQEGEPAGHSPTLRRIERLRAKIERTGSPLKIGASLLTQGAGLQSLRRAAAAVRAAGAHWLYLHPTCVSTPRGTERARGQELLFAALDACRREQPPGFAVHYLAERFSDNPVAFQGYHAAHFIMVVGADGDNYLSSETKYQPRYRIAPAAAYADDDFFRSKGRLKKIAAVHSAAYPAGGSRNRGILYNQVLETAMRRSGDQGLAEAVEFILPHIL